MGITLVCDRSGSMEEGDKLAEQRKSAVFLMEALKKFAERCDEETVNMEKPLAEQAEKLSIILADLLKEHLQNI